MSIMIESHTRPATTKSLVSVVVKRTPIKTQATREALITAIASATTTFQRPSSTYETADVVPVSTTRVAQMATNVLILGMCTCALMNDVQSDTTAETGRSRRYRRSASKDRSFQRVQSSSR